MTLQIIPGRAIELGSDAEGDLAYHDGSKWTRLALGTSFLVPTGVINPYAGATAPVGWLLCFGQSISRTTYATLFTAIGTTYGSVSGTTFNLPDMRGQVTAGLDNMGGTSRNRILDTDADVLGGEIGDSGGHTHGAHALTEAEMPSHSHTVILNLHSGTDAPHGPVIVNGPPTPPHTPYTPGTSTTGGGSSPGGPEGPGDGHTHTSEEALQPTIFLNYIIKT
jgi:microcystin-dependent protein